MAEACVICNSRNLLTALFGPDSTCYVTKFMHRILNLFVGDIPVAAADVVIAWHLPSSRRKPRWRQTDSEQPGNPASHRVAHVGTFSPMEGGGRGR